MSASDSAHKAARRLRREMSLPETLLWVRLRRSNLHFRRQHPIGAYILDFYCAAAKLAIEVDGAAHDFGDRPMHDQRRTEWLTSQGIEVVRIEARTVLRDPDSAADALLRLGRDKANPSTLNCVERSPSPRAALARRSKQCYLRIIRISAT